ncbi:hypothetical protein Q4S45_03040 [Massilia sp. R2A-15]|uniref:hypothetical protein n=1 Tax=Massilia sp. R2A-15 TaxID=3064278 RepID=UPI002732749F|nr:hypothetical protein [Massilia sp. R2A-15]WLI90114.1 hypothetical protein Q4S45_03040 [Massilia sp. R2A-15]
MPRFIPIAFAVFACGTSALLHAQTLERPLIKEGDRWVYSVRSEEPKGGILTASTRKFEGAVTRVGSHAFILARKATDSNLPAREVNMNLDWSVSRIVSGKDVVTGLPFDFPLKPGRTWDTDSADQHPNPLVKTLRNKQHYTVLGWEQVTVPAGTFKALKIEMEGEWSKEFEPQGASATSAVQNGPNGASIAMHSQGARTPDPTSGRLYKLTWYVPEVKREVKMLSEDYDQYGAVQHRTTAELDSFSVN